MGGVGKERVDAARTPAASANWIWRFVFLCGSKSVRSPVATSVSVTVAALRCGTVVLHTASVFLLHRCVTPDSMHVLQLLHGVRPVELQVDPELQLVAAFTMVNPKRPYEEKEGVRKGRREEGREV